jgi:hypothetical protein
MPGVEIISVDVVVNGVVVPVVELVVVVAVGVVGVVVCDVVVPDVDDVVPVVVDSLDVSKTRTTQRTMFEPFLFVFFGQTNLESKKVLF